MRNVKAKIGFVLGAVAVTTALLNSYHLITYGAENNARKEKVDLIEIDIPYRKFEDVDEMGRFSLSATREEALPIIFAVYDSVISDIPDREKEENKYNSLWRFHTRILSSLRNNYKGYPQYYDEIFEFLEERFLEIQQATFRSRILFRTALLMDIKIEHPATNRMFEEAMRPETESWLQNKAQDIYQFVETRDTELLEIYDSGLAYRLLKPERDKRREKWEEEHEPADQPERKEEKEEEKRTEIEDALGIVRIAQRIFRAEEGYYTDNISKLDLSEDDFENLENISMEGLSITHADKNSFVAGWHVFIDDDGHIYYGEENDPMPRK